MMKKSKTIWITRDHAGYTLWSCSPFFNGDTFEQHSYGDNLANFCEKLFESITRFRLAQNESQRIRILIEQVGPVWEEVEPEDEADECDLDSLLNVLATFSCTTA